MAKLNHPIVHPRVGKRRLLQGTVRPYRFKRQWLLLLFPAALALSWWGKTHPQWTEQVYALKIYKYISQLGSTLSGWVPFSLAELCIIGLILLAVYLVIRLIRSLHSTQRKKSVEVVSFLSTIGAVASVLYLFFVLNCGLNYNRSSFTDYSGLTVRPSSVQELEALCAELVEQVNILRPAMQEDASGVTALPQSSFQTAQKAKEAFDALSQNYPVLEGSYAQPKPVLFSYLMSYTQITGFFFPFTFEANVNILAPDYTIPATMCHELAHLRGFMREDEANFIGYLACMASDQLELQYSGTMLALLHSMNSLYTEDYEAFLALYQQYDAGVRRDFDYNNWYWQQFEGPVAEVSDAINDTYLKINHQSDGVKSYGRMVDLLLADYRQRHGLS